MLHSQRSSTIYDHRHHTFLDIFAIFRLTWKAKETEKRAEYIKLLPLHSSELFQSSFQDMSLFISSSSPISLLSTSTLLTIPPELLLQIISHLPSTSALYALSLTSRTLNTFLHTHAATITNYLISSHHINASQILGVDHTPHSAGFLVPTHPLVLTEERRIQRDKIIASGCHCPPCRLMLHSGTSSSSDLSLHSSSEHDCLVSSCHPGLSMVATRGRDCNAKAALDRTIKLTEPGPQFLVFLERYGWEVEARWAVMVKNQHESIKEEVEGDDEPHTERQDEEEKRKVFEFMIGNYCVRRFLEDAEKELTRLKTMTEDINDPTPEPKKRLRLSLKRKLPREKVAKAKFAIAPSRPPAARMFGEIEKTTTISVEKESWVKGLLWYHGSKYSLDSQQIVDPVTGSDKGTKTKTKSTARDCMKGVNRRVRNLGSSIGNILRHLRCVGDFQSLDD